MSNILKHIPIRIRISIGLVGLMTGTIPTCERDWFFCRIHKPSYCEGEPSSAKQWPSVGQQWRPLEIRKLST